MWKYRRRLSIRPVESAITFAGARLIIAADGRVLSPVSDELAVKMKAAPHSFIFDVSLKAAPAPAVKQAPEEAIKAVEPVVAKDQKVEISSDKDDTSAKRKRRSRKSAEG